MNGAYSVEPMGLSLLDEEELRNGRQSGGPGMYMDRYVLFSDSFQVLYRTTIRVMIVLALTVPLGCRRVWS